MYRCVYFSFVCSVDLRVIFTTFSSIKSFWILSKAFYRELEMLLNNTYVKKHQVNKDVQITSPPQIFYVDLKKINASAPLFR